MLGKFFPTHWLPVLTSHVPHQGSVRRIRLSKDPNNKDRSPSGTSNLHGSWRSFGGKFCLGNFQNVEKQTNFWLKLIRNDVENVYAVYVQIVFFILVQNSFFAPGVLRIGWNWRLRNDLPCLETCSWTPQGLELLQPGEGVVERCRCSIMSHPSNRKKLRYRLS